MARGLRGGIELAQFAGSLLEGFSYRITDVDDAIMNAAGAMAAFFAWRWIERWRWPSSADEADREAANQAAR